MVDPMNLATAIVRGRFLTGGQDGADPDTNPDVVPLKNLAVKLEPLVKILTIPAEVPGDRSSWMLLETFDLSTNDEGLLYNPKADSLEPDIKVIAANALTDDPNYFIRWRATITAPDSGVAPIVKTIAPLAGEIVDLPTADPVPDTPVINLTEWMQLVADARASKDLAILAAQQSEAAADRAESAVVDAAMAAAEQTAEVFSTLLDQRGNVSGVLDLSAVAKNAIVHLTATGNITSVTLPAAPVVGRIITLVISQDATGGRTIKLPGVALAWGASTDVVLSRTANSVDVLHLMHDGVRWVCLVAAQQIAIPASWAV